MLKLGKLKLNSSKKSKRNSKNKRTGRSTKSKGLLLSRRRFSLKYLIIIVVALAAIGGTLIHFSLAATSNPSIYYNYDSVIQFDDINQTRQSVGKSALTESTCLDKEAQAWAAHMASTGVLAHPSNIATDINAYCDGDWQAIAQNVGSGNCAGALPDTCSQQIYNAFQASSGHYGNIIGNYVKLGVGTVRKGSNLWIVHSFATCTHCSWGRWQAPTPPATNVPSGWTSWSSQLGGQLTSGVTAASRAPGIVEVFAAGNTGNNVITRTHTSSGWSGWSDLGGCTTQAPEATVTPVHNTYLFVRSCSNDLYYKKLTQSGWSNWHDLGAYNLTSSPGAAVWQNDSRIDVFYRGSSNYIYDVVWTGSDGWHVPVQMGTAKFSTAPDAVSVQDGNVLKVYSRGYSDGKIYERTLTKGGSWSDWHTISSAYLKSGPEVTAWHDGNDLMLFSRGQDNAIWGLSYTNGKWASSWQSLRGICADDPGVASTGSNSIILFCESSSNQLQFKNYNSF